MRFKTKMGRKGYKVLFCAFCLDQNPDQVADNHSFDQEIDVSHLATPHISSNLSLAVESSSNSTPVGDSSSSDDNNNNNLHHYQQPAGAMTQDGSNHGAISQNHHHTDILNRCSNNVSPIFQQQTQQDHDNNNNQPQSILPPTNLYELQPSSSTQPAQDNQSTAPQLRNSSSNLQSIQDQHATDVHRNSVQTAPKLSYDVISVREPLAKILAERQQIQQALMQQRQILGDHEYIEVYGERGSSCFYEEIAGSTTSSATYDQIGASSNHNYQVLINAYALANRSNSNQDLVNGPIPSNDAAGAILDGENLYDVASHRRTTSHSDQTDRPATTTTSTGATVSTTLITGNESESSVHYESPTNNRMQDQASPQRVIPTDRIANNSINSGIPQATPVYSVINKATRRSKAGSRPLVDTSRPPQPPPKNVILSSHQTTSAILSHHQDTTIFMNAHNPSGSRGSPQIPTTSSYMGNNSSELKEHNDHHNWLPHPPPRFSKFSICDVTNRPLPLPDMFDGNSPQVSASRDEDLESANNGYELLASNFDDDQIDVGYEKIRESNRYSGGSMSSQFCPLQALDNCGYESVQPIYSSPSNALVEPNYEAIEPTTAAELAASATAKLTAAATVIEQFLKQENP